MATAGSRRRSSSRAHRGNLRVGLAAAQTSDSGGEIGSGFSVHGGIPDVDYLDELGWPEYVREFRRVANDGMVAKTLRSLTFPLITADWSVEPASDDPRDVMIAELCGANLYRLEGETFGREFWMARSWRQRLTDVLRFLQFGHALFYVTLKQVGKYIVVDDMKYLEPDSVERWIFDDGDRLVRVERQYTDATGRNRGIEVIAAERLKIYTWDRRGGNVLGTPILRSMWRDYVEKDKLRKVQMIDAVRTKVGVPFYKQSQNAGVDEIRKGDQLAKMMRGQGLERIWANIPDGSDFGWKEGGISGKAFDTTIGFRDEQMAKAGMTQVTELGMEQSGGSRGVSGTHAAFAERTLSAIGLVVEEQENDVVRFDVDMNWSGVRGYPKLKVSRIDPFELTRSIPEFLDSVTKARALGDVDLENEIRRRYGFEEVDPDSVPRRPQVSVGGGDEDEDAVEEEDQGGPEGGSPPASAARRRVGLSGHDSPERVSELERDAGIDPERARASLERHESTYYGSLRAVLRDMRAAVVDRVREGGFEPKKAGDVPVPFQSELRQRLLSVLQEVRDFGRETVRGEVEVQLSRRGRRTELASDPGSRRGAISFANRNAEVLVNIDVETVVSRLQAQVAEELNRIAAARPSAQEAASAVRRLLEETSDRQIEDMARKSTSSAFNLGRNIAIQELRAHLEPEAVRTEVMDDNTCQPCRDLHGLRVRIGSEEYFNNQPPAGCEGKLRCRAFYLVFPK